MSTKDVLLQQLEAERFKRKGLEDRISALAGKAEVERTGTTTPDDTIEQLEAEITVVDAAIAECELGLVTLPEN